jgi:glycosyltransferase involved in cell wall biosynthesis
LISVTDPCNDNSVQPQRSSKKLRVFALIAANEVTGPCRGLFQLAQHMDGIDDPFVIGMFLVRHVSVTPSIEEARRRGFRVVALSQRRRYDCGLLGQALKLVRTEQVTLLQSQGYKAALIAWYLKRVTGLPWIAFADGYTSENRRIAAYNRLDQWLMRKADHVVPVSAATKELLRLRGVSPERMTVVYNAIDPQEYTLSAGGDNLRKQWNVGKKDLLVGVLGRLSPEKGQAVFLRAFQAVAARMPSVRAVIVGDGLDRAELEALATAHGFAHRVRFVGFQQDVSSVYAALDLVVIPSFSEGLPLVLLEALLHRKAVVATRVGGIPEIMAERFPEWLVNPNDKETLAHTMIAALENPGARRTMGMMGDEYVRACFSPGERAKTVLDIYEDLLVRTECRAGNPWPWAQLSHRVGLHHHSVISKEGDTR